MEIYDHSNKSMQELMTQETLTPKELSTLLSIDIDSILTACFRGSLKSHIVDPVSYTHLTLPTTYSV